MSVDQRIKVLYFTVVPLGDDSNGGSMCCRNHVRRLAEDPNISLFVLTAGPAARAQSDAAFLESLQSPYQFAPILSSPLVPESKNLAATLHLMKKVALQYPRELEANNQPQIEDTLSAMIRGHGIDILVIDYLPSSFFIQMPRNDCKTVLLTLNREADFYADQIRLGHVHHGPTLASLSLQRLRRYERRLHAGVDCVVTLSPRDLPRSRTRRPPCFVTPCLEPQPVGWTGAGSNTACFIGNIGHYPNALAINWITGCLGPALLAIHSPLKIRILGASPDQLPVDHLPSNVELMGVGDANSPTLLLRSSGFLLCPVENDYGVKFKTIEALSLGVPVVGSQQTMLGLPHLIDGPAIDLRTPHLAALQLTALISETGALEKIQRRQQQAQTQLLQSQQGVWSRLLSDLRPMDPIPSLELPVLTG